MELLSLALVCRAPTSSNDQIDNLGVTGVKAKRSELARVCSHILKNVLTRKHQMPDASMILVQCQNYPYFPLLLESVVQASLSMKDKILFENATAANPLKLPCSFYCSLGSKLRNADLKWHLEG